MNKIMKNDKDTLEFYQRDTETVSIQIPREALGSLRKVAVRRDISEQALLKFYIGQGLRQDLSRLHSEHVLETAATVLARHLESEEEVSTILQEIRTASAS